MKTSSSRTRSAAFKRSLALGTPGGCGQLAIIDAARGDVRVAHYGRLQERSLAKLAASLRPTLPA